jgi:hypothetical protein
MGQGSRRELFSGAAQETLERRALFLPLIHPGLGILD